MTHKFIKLAPAHHPLGEDNMIACDESEVHLETVDGSYKASSKDTIIEWGGQFYVVRD